MKRAAVVVGALLLIALVMALRGPSGEPDKAGDVQPGGSDAPDAPAEDAQSPSAVSDESVADAVAPTTGDAETSASSIQGVDGESAAAATAEADAAPPEVPRARRGGLLVIGEPEPTRVYLGSLDVVDSSPELRLEREADNIVQVWGVEPGTGVLDLGTTKMTFDVVTEAPPVEDAEEAPVPDGGLMNLWVGDQVPFPVPAGAKKVSFGCSEGRGFIDLGLQQLDGERVVLLRALSPGRAVCRIVGVDITAMIRAE